MSNNQLLYPLVEEVSTLDIFTLDGNSKIALIMMVKNEEDIIFENLVWHFSIGFRKFVIINNLSNDRTSSIIEEFIKSTVNHTKVFVIEDPIVEYIQSRVTTGAYQLAHSVWPEVDWIFPVDADEFWTPRKDLSEIISDIPSDINIIKSLSARYHPTEDYHSFDADTKFYNKLHYHSPYFKSDDVRVHRDKIILRAKNYFKIEQGNHDANIIEGYQESNKNYINGNQLGLNLFEFQLRSVEHAHSKFFNGMTANLKAKKSGMIPEGWGTHWDEYSSDIKNYGNEAAEVKFNKSLVDSKKLIDDKFPLEESIRIFHKIIEDTNETITSTRDNFNLGVTNMLKNQQNFQINQNGAWSGLSSEVYHRHDQQLAQELVSFFDNKNAGSVLELGAGLGLYTKTLQENGIFSSCYDGNIDTQTLSKGKCGILDLSLDVKLAKHDWVLCLEVGEHLPKQYEDILLNNIIQNSKYGIVMSWAVPGQTGDGHVNEQSNEYIKLKMSSLGYKNDIEAENVLRESSTLEWFKNTIMVFEPAAEEVEISGSCINDCE